MSGRGPETGREARGLPPTEGAPARHYARVRFARRGRLRFLGHLDLARAFDRAVRRAGLPVAYTEGFNPHAKISFAHPLALGVESEAEMCLIEFPVPADGEQVARRLGAQLPEELQVLSVEVGRRGRRSPLADLTIAGYEAELSLSGADEGRLREAVEALLAAESVEVSRRTKRTEATINIRRGILALGVEPGPPVMLSMRLRIGDEPLAKPDEVIEALGRMLAPGAVEVTRLVRTALE